MNPNFPDRLLVISILVPFAPEYRLDAERIEPTDFKTVVARGGIGFEISFKSEHEARYFRERFSSLVPV